VNGSAPVGSAPEISVVIPCYNAARWLPMQLNALAAQDFPGTWEVIVADNGSTDSSAFVARSYAARLPGLQVIDASAVRGASFAYNAGAARATGKAIAFCDADDVVAPGWLNAMAAGLQHHPVVAGRFEGQLLNEQWTLSSRQLPQLEGLQGLDTPPYLPHAGSGNLGLTRRAWLDIGGFDVGMAVFGDTDLCWRLVKRGYDIHFERDAVVHVRLRPSLRGIWHQAYSYGCALAELHERHDVNRTHIDGGRPGERRKTRYRLFLLPLSVHGKASLARLLWEYGWRVGQLSERHRRLRAVEPRTPPQQEDLGRELPSISS
jgi:glycosyltransferase involved in cell wall biosynthesis